MATINHLSVAAKNPKLVASHLARLTDGKVEAFRPLAGAYVCLWNEGWEGAFIEVYPEGTSLKSSDGGPEFQHTDGDHPNATHINLTTSKPQDQVKAIADELGLPHRPRGWGGVYDVWLEEGLLVELVSK